MNQPTETSKGYLYALLSFLSWGLLPIFWKGIKMVPAFEILAHRIFWSFLFLLIWILFKKRKEVHNLLLDRKKRNSLFFAGILVSSNWGVYIYAVNSDRIMEASLGYYINPLVSVFLGILLLGEKLDRLKQLALVLASAAVLYFTIDYGRFPYIALYLALSFGFYGLMKKRQGLEAMSALTIETLSLAPLAALFIGYKVLDGSGSLFMHSWQIDTLLLFTGIITTLPLYWFSRGAQKIPLTSIGFMQYITPTIMLILAVMVYKEPFPHEKIIAFGMIWLALGFYSIAMWKNARNSYRSI
ncbi:EamA family transporter RarD [Ancylomarina salipaludis]|uniref:EamA family transporter RarD n=1 Tax=Ancylomarina salipaludis TaxID=2501299 RepID=A0A4Q1JK25_9BACT|nr:EamA family transporter RarD [Ancylomarina salipaludis]RXQ92254.1 EamA family transporter RarD [Ancylomarina salipaludis]